jgi:hypothetical protein
VASTVPYNGRRQRIVQGLSPDMVLRGRPAAEPKLANARATPPDPEARPKALKVVADAKGGLASRQLDIEAVINQTPKE